MIRIISITIKRFRSILDLTLPISLDNNIVAICGQNNVGKTNTLRAISLFFHPELYIRETDMPEIKKATGGQAIYPVITISFYDDESNTFYEISRKVTDYEKEKEGLKGKSYQKQGKRKNNITDLNFDSIKHFLNSIEFVYVESINVFIPELIERLTNDMIDVQYNKQRFSSSKIALKESYDKYVDGVSELLTSFQNQISSTFKQFQNEWSVKFIIPKNSDTVRDLLSKDITLTLEDNGSEGIVEKGSGLQRLATILLTYEMLSRLKKKKHLIVCIDEPDIYLHEGLQKKLKQFFEEKSSNVQLFYTTHSRVFINLYSMKNVFLLESSLYKKYSVRKNKDISVTETKVRDLADDAGYQKICRHLGIEKISYDILDKHNIIVEGRCDKKYIDGLAKYFHYESPNYEVLNGADNATKYLEFYESYYKNSTSTIFPIIKIVFDNDSKGREMFKKINAKKFNNIKVKCVLLNNYQKSANLELENNNTNNEIEDFIYPDLLCYLVNELLKRKNMNTIDSKKVCREIKTKSFSSKGILELCEHEKNSNNPESGADFSFTSSSDTTNRIKEGLAGLFNLEANLKLQELIEKCNEKYPFVKEQIKELMDFQLLELD